MNNSELPPDDDPLFEIIDGQRVNVPPRGALGSLLANFLVAQINAFARTCDIGRAVAYALFALAGPMVRDRRPDAAFLSYQRWPKNQKTPHDVDAWPVVPDLAIQIVSRWDRAAELQERIDDFLRAGVRLVWVVYPKTKTVEVYESTSTTRILTKADLLNGGAVLPGFQLSLKDLFLE